MRSVVSPVLVAAAGARRAVSSTSPNGSSSGAEACSNEPGNRQRRTSSATAPPSPTSRTLAPTSVTTTSAPNSTARQSRLADLERTVAALDTWQRWANGDTITVEGLRDTVEALTTGHGTEHDGQHRALGHAIQTWAGTAGVDLHLADRQPPPLHQTGLELGL